MECKKIAIAYIPVLHQGYIEYLKTLEEQVATLYLISDEILAVHEELDYINRKDRLRALPHEVMKLLLATCTSLRIESLTLESITKLKREELIIVAPDEDINHFVHNTYFSDSEINYHNVFLRWNRNNLGEETEPNTETVSLEAFDKEVMGKVVLESKKSADWWRQVGAALVKDGELLAIAHNEHMPEKEFPNIFGDTRSLFKKGTNINFVTTAHAEAAVIADAAKRGVSTNGATLFTTDFPCPYCARIIAKSGVTRIYFMHGYNVLGGEEFFRALKIETVKVQMEH